MFRFAELLVLVCSLSFGVRAQDERPAAPPRPAQVQDPAFAVRVPIHPNSTCPIMGKKVSVKLFTDVEYGRIYICCKGCDKKIIKDVATAYKSAYPTTKKIENKDCPITGKAIGEDAQTVTLQGHDVRVCCKDCIPVAQASAQVVLAKVTDDKVVDLKNQLCPVTGGPVTKNDFAIIGTTVVHLSSPECVDEVLKDPRTVLAKAKESAKQQKGEQPRPGATKKDQGEKAAGSGKQDEQGQKGEKKTRS
jgi:hypothetical protein